MNSALVKVGTKRISSESDPSREGIIVTQQYPLVRDQLLGSHPWTFALKRYQSSALVDTPIVVLPDEDFTHTHQLPADFLRIQKIDIDFPENWKIEGDKLLCLVQTIKYVYIFKQTDVTKYSPQFSEALAAMLAADISYAIAQSTTLTQGLYNLAEIKLREARSSDSQGKGQVRMYEADEWFNSRY